jgi:TM2 domain-containing membrane protein YozV
VLTCSALAAGPYRGCASIDLFTLGLLGAGWRIDLFLIPAMDREADFRRQPGPINDSVAWILLTVPGLFGVHRMYMGKWVTGVLCLLTLGLVGIGYLADDRTLNHQITVTNAARK